MSISRISTQHRSFLACSALLIACLAAYFPALRGQFLWDDDRHVSQNKALRSLDGLCRIWLVPRTTPQYYPLTHTSFWIEWQLWHDRTIGYHLVNVLLHATNALLLWRLLRMLSAPGAWAAAMLFALHPIQVESVAWISERKNLLAMLFYLCALITWWRGVNGRGRRTQFIASFVLFVLALLAKTVACSMPAVALVVLWWKRGRVGWRDVRPLLPFFVVGAALAILTGRTERDYVGAAGPDWQFSGVQRLLIASRAAWFYAAKLLWPTRLTFSYPRWEVSASQVWQYAFVFAALGVLVSLWFARHRLGRGALAAVLIFGGVLVPALGFVNIYPMRYSFVADHFQYMAGAALIALATAAMHQIARRFASVTSIFIAAIFLILTWLQAHIYANPESLWRDTITKNQQSWMANHNLAVLLSRLADADRAGGRDDASKRKLDEANILFARADALRPGHEMLPFNWAEVLFKLGRLNDAIAQNNRYLARTAVNDGTRWNVALAHDRIGEALVHMHRPGEAAAEFDLATQIVPTMPEAWLHLAAARDQEDQPAAAIVAYEQYLRLVPRDASVLTWLGQGYGRVGRFSDAADAFTRALEIDPTRADAKRGLAMALSVRQRTTSRPASSP